MQMCRFNENTYRFPKRQAGTAGRILENKTPTGNKGNKDKLKKRQGTAQKLMLQSIANRKLIIPNQYFRLPI